MSFFSFLHYGGVLFLFLHNVLYPLDVITFTVRSWLATDVDERFAKHFRPLRFIFLHELFESLRHEVESYLTLDADPLYMLIPKGLDGGDVLVVEIVDDEASLEIALPGGMVALRNLLRDVRRLLLLKVLVSRHEN